MRSYSSHQPHHSWPKSTLYGDSWCLYHHLKSSTHCSTLMIRILYPLMNLVLCPSATTANPHVGRPFRSSLDDLVIQSHLLETDNTSSTILRLYTIRCLLLQSALDTLYLYYNLVDAKLKKNREK